MLIQYSVQTTVDTIAHSRLMECTLHHTNSGLCYHINDHSAMSYEHSTLHGLQDFRKQILCIAGRYCDTSGINLL